MNFLKTIGHFLKHIAVFVSDVFVQLFGSDAAHTFAVAAESLLHSALGQIAFTAVQEAEALATGTEKKAAAFEKIVAGAQSAGITVTESVVNMILEIAVQKLKGEFGPQPQ
jgi:hypothetical protein